MLLALAMLAGAFTFTVARAEPAWAYTIDRGTNEIVVTSNRLQSLTVYSTQIVTLQRDGQIFYVLDNIHNSGATRKFFNASVTIHSPATGLDLFYTVTSQRIEGRTYQTFPQPDDFSPLLRDRYNDIRNDPDLQAYFFFEASRL